MAPEQLRGENTDARTDIWGLGTVLYEIATSQRPFREELATRLIDAILHETPKPPRALNGTIPADLERIILKCLDKDPENRYQSAKELVVDLRRLEATSTGVAVAAPLRKGPRRWLLSAIGGAAVSALIAATLLLWPLLASSERAGAPALRWEQLTNFDDSAEIPALSPDGKLVAFLRGPGSFRASTDLGRAETPPACRRAIALHQFLPGQQPSLLYANRRSVCLEHLRTAAVGRAGTEAVYGQRHGIELDR